MTSADLAEARPPIPVGRQYLIAVLVSLATVALRWSLADWIGQRPILVLYLIPIIISSYLGGTGPGLVATGIAAAASSHFMLTPGQRFSIANPVDLLNWLLMVSAGTLVSLLNGALLRSRHRDAETIEQLNLARDRERAAQDEANQIRAALDEHATRSGPPWTSTPSWRSRARMGASPM